MHFQLPAFTPAELVDVRPSAEWPGGKRVPVLHARLSLVISGEVAGNEALPDPAKRSLLFREGPSYSLGINWGISDVPCIQLTGCTLHDGDVEALPDGAFRLVFTLTTTQGLSVDVVGFLGLSVGETMLIRLTTLNREGA